MAEPLITIEGGDDGVVQPLPAAFQAVPAPAAAAPAPVPAPTPASVAPAPVAAAPAAVVPPADEAEPEADESDPRQAGLLHALRRERTDRKALRDQLAGVTPILTALGARPDLVEVLRSGKPLNGHQPPATEPPKPLPPAGPSEAELEALAQDLSLITTEGKWDTAAARKVHDRMERQAEAAVEKAVGPLRATVTGDKAESHRTQALKAAADFGIPANIASYVFDGLMRTNPEALSDPQQASGALMMAAGMHYLQGKAGKPLAPLPAPAAAPAPAPAANPNGPIFVEGPTKAPVALTMSSVEQNIAKRNGIKPADWLANIQALTDAQKRGDGHIRFNSEED